MQNLKDMELHELIKLKEGLEVEIIDRTRVVNSGIEVEHGYIGKIREFQAKKKAVLAQIDKIFDELNEGVKDGYQFAEDIFAREKAKLSLDDDGRPIMDTVSTNIDAFDDHLFKKSNGGIPIGSYFGIVGESNSGKSDIVYMMMRGFLENGEKIHFHSYELGESSIYRTLSSDHKNKLRGIAEQENMKKMLSVDTQGYEIDDLIRIIKIRAMDGVRIFIIDSLTKITINGSLGEVEIISDALLKLTHELNILTVVVGQKSKSDIENDIYQIYGSIQVQHHFDILLFIELENKFDRLATRRMLWLEKNREDKKDGVITDYNEDEFKINYVEDSDGTKSHSMSQKAGAHSKATSWAKKIGK